MLFGSGIARGKDEETQLEEVCRQALKGLNGKPVDLAFFFVTPHFKGRYEEIRESLQKKIKAEMLLGCTAVSVIGSDQEVEADPAMSLFLAHLPGVKKNPILISQSDLDGLKDPASCRNFFGVAPEDKPTFLLIPDPFSFDINSFLELMRSAYPETPVIGGMASGANAPGENALFTSGDVLTEGAVGVVLAGDVQINAMVSQGCRPFGEPVVITEAQENVIMTLAGQPALFVLQEMYQKASSQDQNLARQALFIGQVADEYKQNPEQGDFVIRNLIGVDEESGALAVSDYVHVGETVQFHVRDSKSAHEDLESLCLRHSEPKAALIFSCNGRGRRMFQVPNHDVGTLHKQLGQFPTAGFFCAGEIGPIAKKNFMHSFTASVALFYEKG